MRAIRLIHLILNFINLPDYTGAGIAQSVERLAHVLDDREIGVRLSEVTFLFGLAFRPAFGAHAASYLLGPESLSSG
jgi:hypothetical protein